MFFSYMSYKIPVVNFTLSVLQDRSSNLLIMSYKIPVVSFTLSVLQDRGSNFLIIYPTRFV